MTPCPLPEDGELPRPTVHYGGGGAGPLPGVSSHAPGPDVDRFDSSSFCMKLITFLAVGVIFGGMLPDKDDGVAAPVHIAWPCLPW